MTAVLRFRTALLLMVVAAAVASPSVAAAQPGSLPVDLPDRPARDGFDLTHFSTVGHCQLVEGSALLPREIDAPDRFQQAHVTASYSTNARVRSRRW